ncbi:MAG: hypothetical protein E6Q90_01150 [Actinobacteria bacterium]|nr:MAG: hypothetical protein E6Q90_01150 [Actinomycetota bacterium]
MISTIATATAAATLSLAAVLVPAGVATAAAAPAAPAPAAPAPASPAPTSIDTDPARGVMDTRLTIKNDTQGYVNVCMEVGNTCDATREGTLLSPGQTAERQGWSSVYSGDVWAQMRISDDGLPYGPGRLVYVDAGNPVFGWPSIRLEGNDRVSLAAGDTVTRTAMGHTFELHRNVDLSNAKDMWVTIKS